MKRELELLRVKMKETGVDACLIPTSDFHGSEYVGDYFKCREYISGFTGSAGTLVVTLDEADFGQMEDIFCRQQNSYLVLVSL